VYADRILVESVLRKLLKDSSQGDCTTVVQIVSSVHVKRLPVWHQVLQLECNGRSRLLLGDELGLSSHHRSTSDKI
jgi:hypothetical protein